jgi:hypothetical protein
MMLILYTKTFLDLQIDTIKLESTVTLLFVLTRLQLGSLVFKIK